jgi:predicted exporter
MLSIFEKDENIQKLALVNSFKTTTTLFVTIKGFSPSNLKTLHAIEKELKSIDYIKETKLNLSKISISDYFKKNYYLLSKFQPFDFNDKAVHQKLQSLKNNLLDSFVFEPIDTHDPFKIFTFDMSTDNIFSKNDTLALGDYGYLLTAQLDVKQGDMENAKKVEKELSTLFKKYDKLTAFSTLFFTAQNSTIIQSNVHTILYISFALLILVFFITLRDSLLLIANTFTLASSIFVALSISTAIFTELSIFTLAFGAAISSISVDYLFHNYFHLQYLKKGINKTIFIAFFTTALGFMLLQFVSFPLISQLSIFALISLSFSYFQFTFIYPLFKLTPKEKRVNIGFLSRAKPILPINILFVLSILIIAYAGSTLKFDYDLKNLDYDNQALKAKQAIIQDHMPQKTTLLLEAKSLDALVALAHSIQKEIPSLNALSKLALTQAQFTKKLAEIKNYDFTKLNHLIHSQSKELGFKSSYFTDAYAFVEHLPTSYSIDQETFKNLGYEIIEKDKKFYTLATLNQADLSQLKAREGIHIIHVQNLLKATTGKMFSNLLLYLGLAFMSMLLIILYTVRQKTILALNFILFPIAMILLYLSFSAINIMHLFSIIIIIVAGVDYGIYIAQEDTLEDSTRTKEAIFYSLLTSFSGFGILVLSSIGAIHSIGVVISIGIASIFILILFLQRYPSLKV